MKNCIRKWLAPVLFVGVFALAAQGAEDGTHDGKLVSATSDKLVMTNMQGKEHSHTLANDARVTLDGKACKAADLKPATKVRVTTRAGDPSVAIAIEAIDKNPEFALSTHDGIVVSINGRKLMMTGNDGKVEQTCTLTADAKVTCDGNVCKSTDLKPGMRIRVTSQPSDSQAATRVEALDKNPGFAKVAKAG